MISGYIFKVISLYLDEERVNRQERTTLARSHIRLLKNPVKPKRPYPADSKYLRRISPETGSDPINR